jgi:hypothetical protein
MASRGRDHTGRESTPPLATAAQRPPADGTGGRCAAVALAIELYVLEALTRAEHEEVESHLADCPGCQAQLRSAQRVADLLGWAVPSREPPAALHARLLAAMSSD